MCLQDKQNIRLELVRRGCARLIDLTMALIGWRVVELILQGKQTNKSLAIVLCDLSIAAGIACLCEIFLIAWTGTTVGKRIFGIFVYDRERSRISVSRSFARAYMIWRLAFAYGIPYIRIVRLVRLWHGACLGIAPPWDDENNWVIESRNTRGAWGYFAILSVLIAGLLSLLYIELCR